MEAELHCGVCADRNAGASSSNGAGDSPGVTSSPSNRASPGAARAGAGRGTPPKLHPKLHHQA